VDCPATSVRSDEVLSPAASLPVLLVLEAEVQFLYYQNCTATFSINENQILIFVSVSFTNETQDLDFVTAGLRVFISK